MLFWRSIFEFDKNANSLDRMLKACLASIQFCLATIGICVFCADFGQRFFIL